MWINFFQHISMYHHRTVQNQFGKNYTVNTLTWNNVIKYHIEFLSVRLPHMFQWIASGYEVLSILRFFFFFFFFFFKKEYLLASFRLSLFHFEFLSACALWNLNEQQGKRVYRRYIAISLHMRSLVNTAVHRWSNCVSISFYLLYLYWINGLNKLAYRCTESGQRTETESVYHSKRDKQTM